MKPEILQFLTEFAPPDEIIQTRDGALTYRKWLRQEKSRIFKKNRWPLRIEKNKKGDQIALALLRTTKLRSPVVSE